ncbi:MAG: hypothetical protein CMK89_23300 [Pseudomonadales bacterium]|nr:hypothetical protein [Pseudomonadales bacterium]
MKHLKQLSLATLLASVLALAAGAQAASESGYINIDGQPLGLELTPRNIEAYGVKVATQNQFFSIQLKDFPNSVGRAALIDGKWQGLLHHNGQLHLIDDVAASAEDVQQSRFVAQTLNQDMNLGQCGFTPRAPNQPLSNITPRSLTTNALQIDYDSYCTDTVDGVCLVGQLTLVFDSQFESDFGASYQAQAVAIAEYVDLIYKSEFSIVFNKLRMAFGAGDQFGGENNIDAVLDDMTDQRIDGATSSFDPNVFSILHFISGRNYNENGPAIGIAYGPEYASYPTPVEPLLCSGYAIGTSQVFGSGSNRTALTSLIVAHEIGHNFGFLHDGDDPEVSSCSATDFIMGAELNPGATNFSSCSNEAVGPNLSGIRNIERCFDFPINVSLLKDSGNPATADPGTIINTSYTINAAARSDRTLNVRLRGDITTSAATILSASVDASACTISNGGTRYTCNLANASTHNLDLQLQVALSDLNLLHQISSTATDDFDVDSDDNQVQETIAVVGSVDPTAPGTGTPDLLTSNGSGGGAFSWWWSLNLILLFALRRRLA